MYVLAESAKSGRDATNSLIAPLRENCRRPRHSSSSGSGVHRRHRGWYADAAALVYSRLEETRQ